MRKYLLFVLVILCFTLALASSTSYKFPTSTVNTDYSSGVAWTNPNYVQADDANRAQVTLDADLGQNSDWIYCTGFGFTSSDVPSGSTINGIVVLMKYQNTADAQGIANLQLIKSGSLTGTSKDGDGQLVDTEVSFGDGGDLWGATLTQSDVTSSTFGVAVRMRGDEFVGGSQTSYISYVKLQIAYTEPASTVRKRAIQ